MLMKPRQFSSSVQRAAALCGCLLFLFGVYSATYAQQTADIPDDTARAIKLYEQGDSKAAIAALTKIVEEREDDADAWHYLGLAFLSLKEPGSIKEAKQAFEKVTELRPLQADAHALLASLLVWGSGVERAANHAKRAQELGMQTAALHYVLGEASLEAGKNAEALKEAETALTLDANYTDALLTKARALDGLQRPHEAAETLAKYLSTNPDDGDTELWREELTRWQSALQTLKKTGSEAMPAVYQSTMVTQKARLLSKPNPPYTDKARKADISGTVLLSMVLTSTGEVTDIKILRWLRGGLTTEAVKAARQVKFEPAVKDGKPVSQFIKIEYNFYTY